MFRPLPTDLEALLVCFLRDENDNAFLLALADVEKSLQRIPIAYL